MEAKKTFQDASLLQGLQERASRIRELEARAESCLEAEDISAYKGLMQQKAEILENISQELQPSVRSELSQDPALLQEVQASLEGFARRAAQALELESFFFMRMLLYPEDYQQGQANDLEKYLSDLKAQLGQ
jgi:hypothetical protein